MQKNDVEEKRGIETHSVSRRRFLGASLLLASHSAMGAKATTYCAAQPASSQTSWRPEPTQYPAKEEIVQLPSGAKLWYWDTGGTGQAIVLLHPATGSGAIWGYQQPVLAKSGYRVIGYSRRGHYRSEPVSAGHPGTAAGDLRELLDHIGVARCHLVGSAAGGFVPPDFVLSYPDRVLTITIACSLGGVQDAEFLRTTERILPPGFRDLPADFRELSASYRAAHPQGVARWLELEGTARSGGATRQGSINSLQWIDLAKMTKPTLLIAGDADLYMPPDRLRELARHIPNSEHVVIAEAGHSAYWEQPETFNRVLLTFLKKHRARA